MDDACHPLIFEDWNFILLHIPPHAEGYGPFLSIFFYYESWRMLGARSLEREVIGLLWRGLACFEVELHAYHLCLV